MHVIQGILLKTLEISPRKWQNLSIDIFSCNKNILSCLDSEPSIIQLIADPSVVV